MQRELVIPGRRAKDNNWISHWWTGRDLVDISRLELQFGTQSVLTGANAMHPVMDKHYKIGSVGVSLRFSASITPGQMLVSLFKNEQPGQVSSFLADASLNNDQPNKSCGAFSPCVILAPCESYSLTVIFDPDTPVSEMTVIVEVGLEVLSDAV